MVSDQAVERLDNFGPECRQQFPRSVSCGWGFCKRSGTSGLDLGNSAGQLTGLSSRAETMLVNTGKVMRERVADLDTATVKSKADWAP